MAGAIPFNRPSVAGREAQYVAEVMASDHLCGDGPFTKRANAMLEQACGVKKALLTTSCTHALELCAILLRRTPKDEVIVPSFTFVSSVNAFALHGYTPVFADVRPDTLNIDERQLPNLITEHTRAIVVVHYGGVACEMRAILEIAKERGIAVVEDNAHGLFGRYHGQALGTLGSLSTLSFHHTKNISCGEGGALLINDPELLQRAEIVREKGTNRARFFRGEVDKYTWVDVGSSYLPSELNAAYLVGQLEARELIQARRGSIWRRYAEAFADLPIAKVTQPTVPVGCEQPYHLYYLLLPSLEQRTEFIDHMRAHRISTPFHYVPLNTAPQGRVFGGHDGQCPVTEAVADRLLRLPLFHGMSDDEVTAVIDTVRAYFRRT
jgi:dTDP-4-amino-4,6-dideoxygalactose transaminase